MESFFGLILPLPKVRIKIDEEKCTDALECKKCLQICPSAVFITYPMKREKWKISTNWKVMPTHERLCYGCIDLCVKACPKGAIKIEKI